MIIKIPDDKKINLLFSGGMDSTILLYLITKYLCKNNVNTKIICHAFGNSAYKKNLKPIINYIQNKFNIKILLIIYRQNYWIRDIVKQILDIYGGVVYSGCNKVVEDNFTPTKYIQYDTPPVRGPAYNGFHIRPFIDMNKIELMDIYIKEDILDLLKMTHSCGIPSDTPCGECYFCMERLWAATSLNIKDIT
jgi:hypothetical protein